jgi:hypothetical protein
MITQLNISYMLAKSDSGCMHMYTGSDNDKLNEPSESKKVFFC